MGMKRKSIKIKSSLYLHSFRPLAGKWVWNWICARFNARQYRVSVPLRGNGYETLLVRLRLSTICWRFRPLAGKWVWNPSFDIHPRLYNNLCFRPLAGKWVWNIGLLRLTLIKWAIEMFPSPCGEMGMKRLPTMGSHSYSNQTVPVPLRGNGYETIPWIVGR